MAIFLGHLEVAFKYGFMPFLIIQIISIIMLSIISVVFGICRRYIFVIGLSFSSLGAGIGLFMGTARESVVGLVVPALLTFISAFAVYQFDKKADTDLRNALPVAIALLVLSTVCGAMFGAAVRTENVDAERKYAEWRLRFENVELPLELEQLRRELGLSAGPAAEKPAPTAAPSPTRPPP